MAFLIWRRDLVLDLFELYVGYLNAARGLYCVGSVNPLNADDRHPRPHSVYMIFLATQSENRGI